MVLIGMILLSGGSARAADERAAFTLALDLDELITSAVAQMDGIQRPERLSTVSLAAQQAVTLLPQHYEVQPIYNVQTIIGALDDGGWFLISEGNGVCHGALWTADGAWKIRGDGERDVLGQLLLQVIPVTVEADCDGGFTPESISTPFTPLAPADTVTLTSDPEDTVRVLVVYDAEAASDVGNMSTFATSAVNSANQAYLNSQISPLQLELAGIEEIDSPTGTSSSIILRQLTNRYDNAFDEVHALRDAYDADLVAFLIDISGFCGIAWLGPEDPLYGFSVIDTDCAVGNLSFAHELGHNFGCNHDPNNASSAYTAYGFGHHWNNDTYRSVMAYSPGTRVPYFSNPDVLYAGGATGIANERDNARTINLTDILVANMRTGDGAGTDCDNNGTPDIVEIARDPLLDSDENGTLDICQIAADTAFDCDHNGMIDAEQFVPKYTLALGPISPLNAGSPIHLTSGPLPNPIVSSVRITVGGTGDLGSLDEYVTVDFNSGVINFNAFTAGNDCSSPGQRHVYTASAATFTPIAANGVDVTITPSSAVAASSCTYSSVALTIEYDYDASYLDDDGDGILTACEQLCPADITADGDVDADDFTLLFAQFAQTGAGLAADITGEGVVEMQDVAMLQAATAGGCP